MNGYRTAFVVFWVAAALLGPTTASAQSSVVVQGANSSTQNDPYANPIRRANPNSRQGTVPVTPVPRGPSTRPLTPAPTLENRGIGNGYPPSSPLPKTVRPTAPSLQREDPY